MKEGVYKFYLWINTLFAWACLAYKWPRSAYPKNNTIQLVFSAKTVFFSHNISAGTVFSSQIQPAEQGQAVLFQATNNIFLSHQISQQYFLPWLISQTSLSKQGERLDDIALVKRRKTRRHCLSKTMCKSNYKSLYKFQSLYFYLKSYSMNTLIVYL